MKKKNVVEIEEKLKDKIKLRHKPYKGILSKAYKDIWSHLRECLQEASLPILADDEELYLLLLEQSHRFYQMT